MNGHSAIFQATVLGPRFRGAWLALLVFLLASMTWAGIRLNPLGAKVVRHAKYVVFQMAEVAVPRDLFAAILQKIDQLRECPGAG